MVCSHNDGIKSFFSRDPYVKIHRVKWRGKTPNYKRIAENIGVSFITEEERDRLPESFKCYKNDVYLSGEEEELFQEISADPYIVLHPFAGEKKRIRIQPDAYKYLVDKLIDQYDMKVVVVGGTYKRDRRLKNIPSTIVHEVFKYEREGLVNLVNKSSLRLPTKLTINAQAFAGAHSAFMCAAWERRIPTVAFVKEQQAKRFVCKPRFDGRWHKDCHAVIEHNPIKAFGEALDFLGSKYL
jgi:ADP-heptose:LPS heptosyltransferase